MKTRYTVFLVIALAIGTAMPIGRCAEESQEMYTEAPAISGPNLVFSYEGDILCYYAGPDGKFETGNEEGYQITFTPSIEEIHPRISGEKVVWEAGGSIFLYRLDSDEEPVNIASGTQADIDGDTIVYAKDNDIYA